METSNNLVTGIPSINFQERTVSLREGTIQGFDDIKVDSRRIKS